ALGNIGYLFLGPENRNFINIMCLTWRTMCITLMNQFLYSDYRWLTLADQQLGRLPRWMEIDKPRIGRLVYRIRLTIYLLTGLLFTFVEITNVFKSYPYGITALSCHIYIQLYAFNTIYLFLIL